jgi:endo-1,4-beta-xylanase
VLDSYGTYTPSEGAGGNIRYRGEVTSDGGVYKIYSGIRYAQGLGDPTWLLYWSVRTERRQTGTITLKNHFDAWQKLGMQMGDFDRQIMAVEGYLSSGDAAVTVKLD